jgi:hypothetical protein
MAERGCRDNESRHLRMYNRLAGMLYDIKFPSLNTQAQLCDLRARLQAVGLLRRLQAAGWKDLESARFRTNLHQLI